MGENPKRPRPSSLSLREHGVRTKASSHLGSRGNDPFEAKVRECQKSQENNESAATKKPRDLGAEYYRIDTEEMNKRYAKMNKVTKKIAMSDGESSFDSSSEDVPMTSKKISRPSTAESINELVDSGGQRPIKLIPSSNYEDQEAIDGAEYELYFKVDGKPTRQTVTEVKAAELINVSDEEKVVEIEDDPDSAGWDVSSE